MLTLKPASTSHPTGQLSKDDYDVFDEGRHTGVVKHLFGRYTRERSSWEMRQMIAKAVFIYKGKPIGEYPIQVEGPGDLGAGAKMAFDEFRKQFPKLSLLDDGVVVCFAKMDETAA